MSNTMKNIAWKSNTANTTAHHWTRSWSWSSEPTYL